ncbi:MAG: hypothetical protein IJT94_16130, partial [Oscillibacter sp.]|nr:hypothetical protein [Oscillibacter sp.]
FGHRTQQEKSAYQDAYGAVEWYINTGRVPLGWERALSRADPKKLLDYLLDGDDQSMSAQVERATDYLKRYCRLEEAVWGNQPPGGERNIVLKLTKGEQDLLLDALRALSAIRTGRDFIAEQDEDALEANQEYVQRTAALRDRVSSAKKKKRKHDRTR